MAASRFSTTADFSIQHIWGTTLDDNTGINHSTQVDPKNYGLQIRGSTKILIDNCLIQQTYGDGIWLGHSAADGNVRTQEVRITNTNVNITALTSRTSSARPSTASRSGSPCETS